MSIDVSKDIISKKNKYIDLKQNGRMFPSWILKNFGKYKLPEIIRDPSLDPCNIKDDEKGTIKKEFKKYQIFLTKYLDYRSPYKDILIYHGLGSGKTASSINIYNALYNYTSGWNVFILIKSTLKGTWLDELKLWLNKEEYDYRFNNIVFVHYDSPIADRSFLDAIKNVDSSKKSLYIIDEVHNFIRNVYSNISSKTGKRAQIIYDYIIQDKRENPDTRVILLSGTPAINNPFEIALLFNLLRPNIFPKSENDFNHLFIDSGGYSTISKKNKNLFQRRIMGLVSYYVGSTPDVFAKPLTHYVDCPISEYQEDIYSHFEEIETKLALKMKLSGSGSQTYKSYTRQACNFVFPPISQKINGETRPRPSKFKISEREAEKLLEGRELKKSKDSETYTNIDLYKQTILSFINGLIDYFNKQNDIDKKNNHTILNDVETFLKKYNGDYKKFHDSETKKSNLYNEMWTCSSKMTNIIFNIMNSKGPTVVYSNYVMMEGLEVLKIYLNYFGFYNATLKQQDGKIGYVEYHGGIEPADRYNAMKLYNRKENKTGELIKIILISPAGSEGLSLRNVRQIHILEPYWNEVRITQMIGRGIRQCSHSDLPMEDRFVDIYRYRAVRTLKDKWTTDQYIEDLARSKSSLIQSFLDAMKEVAIDCVLNMNHNSIVEDYKCFQFDEPSLFNKYIGPAYREDINEDMKFDNGLNSTKSIVMKIKVIKIKAVKLLSDPSSDNKEYSSSEYYWFYPDTRTVYDFELHYPIGKIQIDSDNIPTKLDKDTYIIDYVIPIPSLV